MSRVIGTLALGAAMTATAAGFNSPSLYVPGVALLLLAAGAAVWVLGAASGASLERRIGPHVVEEEREWPIEITARTGAFPAPGGELVEPLVRGSLPMAGHSQRRMRVAVRFERRGLRRLEPVRLVIADPLGLVERQIETEAGQEVIVLPRIEPVVAAGGGAGPAADSTGAARPAETAAEVEMESLRPYRDGAPASRIHWPTVARAGTLMERRLLADSDSQPLVVVDPTHPADEAALDMAVRAAASLCVHLARAGGCSLLLPGDRRALDIGPDLGSWPGLHVRLALVEPAGGAPAARLESRRGAIFWVTARAGVPRSFARLNAERYVVTPGPGGAGALFTVAGCAAVSVGRVRRRAA
jgi:uncharacterized protein (DUF58 family)